MEARHLFSDPKHLPAASFAACSALVVNCSLIYVSWKTKLSPDESVSSPRPFNEFKVSLNSTSTSHTAPPCIPAYPTTPDTNNMVITCNFLGKNADSLYLVSVSL